MDSNADIILESLHRGVGVRVAQAWEQPPSICDAIGHHLVGRDPGIDGPAKFPSTRIAEAAADLCIALGLGRFRRPFQIIGSPGFEDLGMSGEALESYLTEELPAVLEGVAGLA
jgi:hypothetical protein